MQICTDGGERRGIEINRCVAMQWEKKGGQSLERRRRDGRRVKMKKTVMKQNVI